MPPENDRRIRRRLDVRGQVQGVGFRPYVYRLARVHELAGWVANDSNGAAIEAEGLPAALDAFQRDLVEQLPPLARISQLDVAELEVRGERGFVIRRSEVDAGRRPEVTPDAATCADCLRELFDPDDRRYRYPFINCTNCGPRYSIIRDVPYDRPATTMAAFTMCDACQSEYDDPASRRFHAQPNACAECGPRLRYVPRAETADARASAPASDAALEWFNDEALHAAVSVLRDGGILALKGIGGYHLVCRADDEAVVRRLRERKLRDGKPLAVMVPAVDAARELARPTATDERALQSVAAPIVLVPKRLPEPLASGVAPGCNTYGLMLPYAPVHHLLFAEGLGPLVMTSANLSGQPLTYRDEDALAQLGDVADAFLLHDREIFRPIDDSVVYSTGKAVVPIRRARGYAPRPRKLAHFGADDALPAARDKRILAVGAELKSTVCLLTGGEAIVSEHLGDLSNADAYRHFVEAIERLKQLYGFTPDVVAHDLHPRYLSTEYARRLGPPTVAVQHHHAHVLSVLAETGEAGPVIGLSCDGTGYGTDGAIWGCEVLRCERGDFERVGHLEYFPLVGGDKAALETWRPAATLLRDALGEGWPRYVRRDLAGAPSDSDLRVFEQQAAAGVNAPLTSSLGRLFDAVAFLLGLCAVNRHEAEAAMALEAAATEVRVEPYGLEPPTRPYPEFSDQLSVSFSALPLIRAMVAARDAGESAEIGAARFHETIARLLADAAERACDTSGIHTVVLTGGCFANRRLLGRVAELLAARHRRVLYHSEMPTGDGGIALGQALAAAWRV